MKSDLKNISKFMSLVLRHQPEKIGLQLDDNGWVAITALIGKLNVYGLQVDISTIEKIVITNDKKRFSFNDDKTKIRANQGHSIGVELNMKKTIPPDKFFHGTAEKFVENIFKTGIQKQNRQHVHLSATEETAKSVGSRHGKPVVLTINAKQMAEKSYVFYLSANNVWLTDVVPAQYIESRSLTVSVHV